MLHQDTAHPHTSNATCNFMFKNGGETLRSPHSPDLALCDFWLFPQLKKALSSKQFESQDAIKNGVQAFFKRISKEDFQKTILTKWKEWMEKYIRFKGKYFEEEREVLEDPEESENED